MRQTGKVKFTLPPTYQWMFPHFVLTGRVLMQLCLQICPSGAATRSFCSLKAVSVGKECDKKEGACELKCWFYTSVFIQQISLQVGAQQMMDFGCWYRKYGGKKSDTNIADNSFLFFSHHEIKSLSWLLFIWNKWMHQCTMLLLFILLLSCFDHHILYLSTAVPASQRDAAH